MARATREVAAEDHVSQPSARFIVPGVEEAPEPVEVVRALPKDKAELLQFMEEICTVYIPATDSPTATPRVEVSVNGRAVIIPRGVETSKGVDRLGREVPIRRYHVERLARAKRTSYRQDLDPRKGEGMNTLLRTRSLEFPFTVIGDSDRGNAWLRDVLAQPA